ncbi:unnamed protein product [Adineta ricciae]|uniref:ATP-dependent DNA helicase n=1 Tax=Adineta ricciae TaxID=249248 RepID=A0A816AJD4_ADIRI|nr:unnamed protein product [Adineta ricciae]
MPTPKPSTPNFELEFINDIIRIVSSVNIHFHTATCFKYSKTNDNPICRLKMPRQIEEESYINIESGQIKLKRLHQTINNFNEYIISACRSNMDIKYIFSGSDAKALVYYITDYVTKSSLSFHDTFSLVLKAVKSFEKQKLGTDASLNAEEKSRRLVLRCYNTLASQQELSGVQVASYLMGWPDHYTTHEFANLYLIGIENYLQAALIEARSEHQNQTKMIPLYLTDTTDTETEENCVETEEQFLLQPDETKTKYVYVNTRVDYQYRSASLDDMCLYDYISFYRKKLIDTKDRKQLEIQSTIEKREIKTPRRGRPVSERESFRDGHPQVSSHINIKRAKPIVPVLLGPAIPRRDRDDTKERYYRSILTLFFPWRSVQDVCDADQSWEQAFQIRNEKITPESRRIIDNIQLLQECKSDRDEHLQQVIEAAQTGVVNTPVYSTRDDSDSDDENIEILDMLEDIDISDIPSIKDPGGKAEHIYFEKVLRAVDQANRFTNLHRTNSRKSLTYVTNQSNHANVDQRFLIPATTELILLNNKWQRQIKNEKERKRNASMIANLESNIREQNDIDENETFGAYDTGILLNSDNNDELLNSMYTLPVTKTTIPSETSRKDIAQKFTLNKNQKAAFMIVTGHLDGMDRRNTGCIDELDSKKFLNYRIIHMSIDDKQDQLIMCVPGCGGTGKSQLIRAITAYFTETDRTHKLRKLAPTSVAAAEIEGMTIHSFLGDGRNRKAKSKTMNRPGQITLENTWRFVEYLILDEMSMVGLSLLARLNKLVATAKHCDPMVAMGGINIIFFGDYIQYSPVFDKPLYHDFGQIMDSDRNNNVKPSTENDIQQKSARALILQINCVVVLEQQMRTKDLAYQALLNRVRKGEGTREDWLLLRTRVIELNNRAVINKAYEIGRSPTVLIATDTIKAKKHIDIPDLTKRLLALPDNKTEHLSGYLPLVSGMPVLLQENIACELGLSNGTQGIFRELVYNEETQESTHFDEGIFTDDTIFVRNAQYALIEIPKAKVNKLELLDPLIIPIPVIDKTFEINLEKLYADKGPVIKMLNKKKLKSTISVKRRGLPIVPAYSITTHKSQGQTLPKIVIDLNMPPGIIEVASAYVPLSRVQQLTDLVILQDFNITALQVKPSKRQTAEINRLATIFEETKRRYSEYFT